MSNDRVARYRLRVQRVDEYVVEVAASSIEEARFFVEVQKGELETTEQRLGVKFVIERSGIPTKYRVVGKHEYVK